ncbi:6-hydroxytryprostatin B O-methyltransferase [Cytospora mali]|uniref:6-hydroxytryprostatin B O-methyltransferase n=1 Tax=Cytospora mali TaxID=578113 RepID=A0A194VL21_CYTMA|nr:6-hydroxytryprostatin B O-methyltransferase [Valsa mali]
MDGMNKLKIHSDELTAAVKDLASHCRSAAVGPNHPEPPLVGSNPHKEAHRARTTILSSVALIRTLVSGPTDFLEHLASQVEILACLQWLGEFQILACIPLAGSVPIRDVAELSGVPAIQLNRIIRLTATAGFLEESVPGQVAHTPLSAPFVENPSLLDAAMFLAETAAPTALRMASAAERYGDSQSASAGASANAIANESAYNLALDTATPFHKAREERSRLNRQWSAYLHHAGGGAHTMDGIEDMHTQLNWSKMGNAHIVEVFGPSARVSFAPGSHASAQSTATARRLAERYPALRVTVQIANDPTKPGAAVSGQLHSKPIMPSMSIDSQGDTTGSRVIVQERAPGSRQNITDASVYILHLPLSSPADTMAELQAHLSILKAGGGVMLMVTSRLLPEPGSIPDGEVERAARWRDLLLLQLTNEGGMEMGELLEMVASVRDGVGGLNVVNRLRSRNGTVGVLVVKYQADVDRSCGPCV